MSNGIALADWYRDRGDATHLVSHPLTENSLVLDVGGYEGNWSAEIIKRYDCFIQIFEPVKKAYGTVEVRFKDNPKIQVRNVGLSDKDKLVGMSLKEDSSCTWSWGANTELVTMLDVKRIIMSPIDLISINIEGDEYDLILEMIESGIIKYCRRLQVQFHDTYLGCKKHRDDIRGRLKKTHEEVYNYPFVWECWRIRDGV